MSLEKWKQLRAIFEHAGELDESARNAYLDEACAGDPDLRREVLDLLRANARAEKLEPPDASRVLHALVPGLDEPTRVGSWKLVRRIGSGGMGTVWEASRVEGGFEQRAAIKLIKRGMDTEEVLARFERERALLASLEHPWIARLYDGGTSADGRPYLVMEHVDGAPFDRHCAEAGRALEDKLVLFAKVCDAVEFAHEHLVVHRDLKPANVLVTADGTPKLLDFGIAKVLGGDEHELTRTTTGQRILTPQYASPEQLRGERISTRSDVFSLGVMLYEVLTGQRPFDETRTPNSEAALPSRRVQRRALAGDLDTIALKALRIEPERRYASAAALAADVRRHLAGEPVEARADTWSYRSTKFLSRHRVLAVATALVILSLAVGLAIASTQYRKARSAGDLAESRLGSVVRFASSLSNQITTKLALLEGLGPQREAMLREICAQLEEIQRQAPGHKNLAVELAFARHDLAAVLGQVNVGNVGKYDEALGLLDQAIREFEPWIASDGRDQNIATTAASLLAAHGDLLSRERSFEKARAEFERARELVVTARKLAGERARAELWNRECSVLNSLSTVMRDLLDRDGEQRIAAEYLALVEEASARFPEQKTFGYWLATALYSRGVSRTEQGDPASARADLERVIERLESLHAAEPDNAMYRRALAPAYYQLSNALQLIGDKPAALAAATHAWEEFEATLRLEPSDTSAADTLLLYAYNAGSIARELKDLPLARRALQRAYDAVLERIARNPDHRSLMTTKSVLGTELAAARAELGEWREALEFAAQSIESALSIENEPGRGTQWNYGMSVSLSNQAECLTSAAADASVATDERRAHLVEAREELVRAKEFLDEGERRGELGADERKQYELLSTLETRAAEALAALPIN